MNPIRLIYRFFIRNWYWIYPVVERIHRCIGLLTLNTENMKRVGIFSPAQEKFITNAIKNTLRPDNKILRWLLSVGLIYFVRAVDNFGVEKIGQEWKVKLIPIVDAGMEGKQETVRRYVTDLLNEKINFRNIPEETELRWFDSITRFIAATIDLFVHKKNI